MNLEQESGLKFARLLKGGRFLVGLDSSLSLLPVLGLTGTESNVSFLLGMVSLAEFLSYSMRACFD